MASLEKPVWQTVPFARFASDDGSWMVYMYRSVDADGKEQVLLELSPPDQDLVYLERTDL